MPAERLNSHLNLYHGTRMSFFLDQDVCTITMRFLRD